MPLFTANRAYPYSVPTDPANVAGALEALAEKIDDDVCALTAASTGRPVARFTGTGLYGSITTGLGGAEQSLPFDTEVFDTANVTMQSQEFGNRLIMPEEPGLYFALATVYVPTLTTAGATVNYLQVRIAAGDASSPASARTRLAGSSHNIPVSADDRNVRVFSVGTTAFMNGTTDAFCVQFFADTTPDIAEYPVADRTLTLLRMTQS